MFKTKFIPLYEELYNNENHQETIYEKIIAPIIIHNEEEYNKLIKDINRYDIIIDAMQRHRIVDTINSPLFIILSVEKCREIYFNLNEYRKEAMYRFYKEYLLKEILNIDSIDDNYKIDIYHSISRATQRLRDYGNIDDIFRLRNYYDKKFIYICNTNNIEEFRDLKIGIRMQLSYLIGMFLPTICGKTSEIATLNTLLSSIMFVCISNITDNKIISIYSNRTDYNNIKSNLGDAIINSADTFDDIITEIKYYSDIGNDIGKVCTITNNDIKILVNGDIF